MTAPTIAILAAGTATRFGRPKQLEPVAPDGAVLMDYALFDAHRAGFRHVLILTRAALRDRVERHVRDRFGRAFTLQLAEQVSGGSDHAPPGTGHAALRVAHEVDGPFGLINADDFYGPHCYRLLFEFLSGSDPDAHGGIAHGCVVAYRIARTIHGATGVSRARCEPDRDRLWGIVEFRDVRRSGSAFVGVGPSGAQKIDRDALVSMNGWGFTWEIRDVLERGYARFRARADGGEFLLSTAVNRAIADRELEVALLHSDDEAFGLTRPDDVEMVRAHIASRTARGDYPAAVRMGDP